MKRIVKRKGKKKLLIVDEKKGPVRTGKLIEYETQEKKKG